MARAPPPSNQPLRIDRQAEYSVQLGASISPSSSSYAALKYNFKPASSLLNPSSPALRSSQSSSSSAYTLTFQPPTSGAPKITYTGTSTHPSQRTQHFLLFDPVKKAFTLERLDAAFVFNAEVYQNAHPMLAPEASESADEEDDDDDDAGGIYNYRNFVGRKKKTAAEEKQEKRLQALKRAGANIIDVDAPKTTPAAAAAQTKRPEATDSEIDAPGESDVDMDFEISQVIAKSPTPPPQPPPPQPTKKAAPKKQTKKAPAKKKAQPAPAPPPPPPPEPEPEPMQLEEDELVIPNLPAAVTPAAADSGSEYDFSSSEEDEPAPAPAPAPAVSQPPQQIHIPTPQPPLEEEDDDFDLSKELDEALGNDEEVVSDEDDAPGGLVIEDDLPARGYGRPVGLGVSGAGTGIRSLADALGGGGVQDESSESEEE